MQLSRPPNRDAHHFERGIMTRLPRWRTPQCEGQESSSASCHVFQVIIISRDVGKGLGKTCKAYVLVPVGQGASRVLHLR